MSKDTIKVNMNVYDIPILVEQLKKLEQENKQLKEQLEYLRSNEYLNQVKWERNFNEELVKDLQHKIDKAKEYIKNASYFDGSSMCANDLLKILGDKE